VTADPVDIAEAGREWPKEFHRLRQRLMVRLGDLLVSVEHVGSTAGPGLAAKPIVDLIGVLRSAARLPEAID
jgi:GrpB-like predicted nucleotidyltransferase (UPF0157 family)